jgi:hypothetical protein
MPRAHVLLLFATGCYYQCGGGMSDQSVTVPGEDGITVKAELDRPRAVLELERSTRQVHGQGEVRYLFDKTLIEQELRLVSGDGGKLATFVVAKHDAASTYASYRLNASPAGDRIAYRLGDEPWRVVHVLSSTLAVHQREPIEGELDWATVPSFTDAFIALYDANELALDDFYSFQKLGPMLEHLKKTSGDDILAEKLIAILDVAFAGWRPEDRAMMTPAVRELLVRKLRARVEAGGTEAQKRALDELD